MASSSGTGIVRTPSRRMSRAQTMLVDIPNEDSTTADSELVPSSLASIAPILRVANEIEQDNRRVAYLCRFHAFEKAHQMDPTSSGRGVRQFKTYLLHRLEREEEETQPMLARSDPREIQMYYQQFYLKNIADGQYKRKPEEMAKIYQIASVLYDVLRTVVPVGRVDDETQRFAKEVEKKKEQFEHYNILPLYAVGVKPAIMELPEIKAALRAIQNVEGLPVPRVHTTSNTPDDIPQEREKPVNDVLDWLSSNFGFQKGNVANQREHLILLLANIDVRKKENFEAYTALNDETVRPLLDKIFKNYRSWCNYLRCKSHLRFQQGCNRQQLELIYISLYLLIWGEASNIRFMPECLCYIFHNVGTWTSPPTARSCEMANDVYGILFSNAHPVSGDTYRTAAPDDESFLRNVITPIYNVLRQEVKRNKGGKASHSKWRNYDDLNEYFWSGKCFQLKWPMNLKADFFVHSDEPPPANEIPSLLEFGNNLQVGSIEEKEKKYRYGNTMSTRYELREMYKPMLGILRGPYGHNSTGTSVQFYGHFGAILRALRCIYTSCGDSIVHNLTLLKYLSHTLTVELFLKSIAAPSIKQGLDLFLNLDLYSVVKAYAVILCHVSRCVNSIADGLAKQGIRYPLLGFQIQHLPDSIELARTFWHLYRSFDRMWIFFVMAFQAMLIVAWNSGSLLGFFDEEVFRKVLTIFITAAFLNFLQAFWAVVLPIGYSSSVQNPTGLVRYTMFWILLLISKLAFSYYVEQYNFALYSFKKVMSEKVSERECVEPRGNGSPGRGRTMPGGGSRPNYKDKTFAFVHFASKEDLLNATSKMNNVMVDGRRIVVSTAKYQKSSFPGNLKCNSVAGPGDACVEVSKRKSPICQDVDVGKKELLNKFRDGRTYKETVVGVRNVEGQHVIRSGDKREVKKPLEVFIPMEERIWLRSSLTGICKAIFEVEFVQRALRSEGINVKVVRWGYAKNACLIVFRSVEEKDAAVEIKWEALSFWLERLEPVMEEKCVPLPYCAVSMIGVPLNCWTGSFFTSLASRWGKLVKVQEHTAQKLDCRVAHMLLRVESLFDIPSQVTINTYGRPFIIKIKVEGSKDFFPVIEEGVDEEGSAEGTIDPWEETSSEGNQGDDREGVTLSDGNLNEKVEVNNILGDDFCSEGTVLVEVQSQQQVSGVFLAGRKRVQSLGDVTLGQDKVVKDDGLSSMGRRKVFGPEQRSPRSNRNGVKSADFTNGIQDDSGMQNGSVSLAQRCPIGRSASVSKAERGFYKNVYARRGLGRRVKARAIRRFVEEKKPTILFLQESKLEVASPLLVRKMGGKILTGAVVVPAVGSAGGLITLWNQKDFVVKEEVIHNRFVALKGLMEGDPGICCFINVYGPSVDADKEQFFRELSSFLEQLDCPVCLGGDFNAVLTQEEKDGGAVNPVSMNCFRDFVSQANLIDLPLFGGRFTWCNNREVPTFESATVRGRINCIKSLKVDNVVTVDPRVIKASVVKFFKGLFNQRNTLKVEDLNLDFLRLSEGRCLALEKPFSEEEVWDVIVHSDSNKAPGPDGLNLGFFKKFWTIMKDDVMLSFIDFFVGKEWDSEVNHSFISLIPKKANPEGLEDFRTISLVGGLYKILSKVLARRLSLCINDIMSPSQFAFIPGRNILDCSFIANECIDFWRKKGLKGVVFKVDFKRTYDSVDWDILMKIMSKMGFGDKWRSWMYQCMSSASISVLVNGSATEKFHTARGLRQGCSLSPLLFNMAGELLHLLLSKAVDIGLFSGFDVGVHDRAFKLSHLQFADDLIIFSKGSIRDLRNVRRVLLIYELLVGLKINQVKSRIYGINVEDGALATWANDIGCSVGSFPSEYLGLPLGYKRNSAAMWEPIVERFHAKLCGWMSNFLMLAGRVVLVKALLGKWVWKFASEKESWWKRVVCGVYDMDPNCIMMGNSWPGRASWIWRGVVKNFFFDDGFGDCIRRNMRLKTGKGNYVQFWNDVWLDEVPLKIQFPRLYVLSSNKSGKVMEFRVNNGAGWEDCWIWSGNGEGCFSAKSCINIFLDQDGIQQKMETWERHIWAGIAPPRVETFVWQVAHQRVGVKKELLKRGVVGIDDPLCSLCGKEMELVTHLFLHYEVWGLWARLLNIWNLFFVIPKNIIDFFNLWDDLLPNSLIWKFIPRALMWSVWKCRNEVIFQKVKLDVVRLFFIVHFRIASWFVAKFKDVNIPLDSLVGDLKLADLVGKQGNGNSKPICWVPPPDRFLKLNVDGAMVKGWDKGGIGGLIRDSKGVLLQWFSERVGGGPPILAELLAIMRGLCLLEDLSFVPNRRFILESDSSNALKWIKNPGLCTPMFQVLVKEIVSFMAGKDIIIKHILRAANWEADKLAKDGIW
ncbi:putative ATP binding protein [Hibiscus syriacus]|uniref:ATP binding protein n=1 Tax=Hibiscus syriacus TaxID=106335 RepID=A0A6A2XSH2_HIBSY|nr:putative ATP binding protein [Hibiscus syriacus]